ncbi:hypothetical protein H5410_016600 [Solanum commersonii]|uniref:Uncharacterized protein n=1 Tax=Solanum commersonii TaxID=4109 RepID=A0A9J5ZX19_SOLCO|nr:hypothetical protein H5410_016600 [Solanum commersonii]
MILIRQHQKKAHQKNISVSMVGAFYLIGKRNSMEDMISVWPNLYSPYINQQPTIDFCCCLGCRIRTNTYSCIMKRQNVHCTPRRSVDGYEEDLN